MSSAVGGNVRNNGLSSRIRWSRRQWLGGAAGLIGLAAAVAGGLNYVISGQYIETTDDAYVGGDITDLAPKISGMIARIDVTDNQAVKAGDVLIEIDDRDFKVAAAKAQADVAGAQAALANLDALRNLQLALINEARAGVAAAHAQVILAQENQARYGRLAANQAGTEQDAQTADANFAQAEAAAEKAAAALTAAQAQLSVIDTQKQEQAAALAGAQASLAQAELNISYTQIRAPIDGVVGNRSAHTGGYAESGAQLISIVPADGLWIDANFKEDQLADMRPGDRVRVSADIVPGAPITGVLESLAPASGAVFSILPAENATGNFTKIVQRVPVRIRLNGSAAHLGLLRPGLSVTVAVDTRS